MMIFNQLTVKHHVDIQSATVNPHVDIWLTVKHHVDIQSANSQTSR